MYYTITGNYCRIASTRFLHVFAWCFVSDKLTAVGNLKQPALPTNPRTLIDLIDQPQLHQLLLTKSQIARLKGACTSDLPRATTPAPPSRLHFVATLIPIDSRSEGFLMAKNQNRHSLRIREKRIKQLENLRMYMIIT